MSETILGIQPVIHEGSTMISILNRLLMAILKSWILALGLLRALLTLSHVVGGGVPTDQSPAEEVHTLLRKLMARAGMTVGTLARRADLTVHLLNSAYLRPGRKTVYTEPDVALAVIQALSEYLPTNERCHASEAVRLLNLTQVPPELYVKIKDCFPETEWNAAIQALFEKIAPITIASKVSAITSRRQLRAPTPLFVGREAERARLYNGLCGSDPAERTTIGLITGMGGSGKTELALCVANQMSDHFPDGHLFIEIHGTSGHGRSQTNILWQIIRALQPENLLPQGAEADQEYLTGLVCSLLTNQRVLIVLDDATEISQIRPIRLPPGSALLVTSRYRLAIPEAVVVEIAQLTDKEAHQLFTRICQHGESYVEQIIKLCGYLPLAITIAAGTLKHDRTRTIARYFSKLKDAQERLRTLTSYDQPEIGIETTIQLSIDRLSDEDRTIFYQLAVFPDSFDLIAAQCIIVAPDGVNVEAHLGRLYKSNLLQYSEEDERYRLHDLVRAFAQGRLSYDHPVWDRHATYYLNQARLSNQVLQQGRDHAIEGLRRFDIDDSHIKAGWNWARLHGCQAGQSELELEYALATLKVGELRYYQRTEYRDWLVSALGVAKRLGRSRDQSLLAGAIGRTWLALSENGTAEKWFADQRRTATDIHDQEQQAEALIGLGEVAYARGEIEMAQVFYREAHQLILSVGNRALEAQAFAGLARADQLAGKLDEARRNYEACLAIGRERGDARGEMLALHGLGKTAFDQGRIDEAWQHYIKQLALAEKLGDRHQQAEAWGGLGYVAIAQRHMNEAEEQFTRQRELAESLGIQGEIADALAGLAHIALSEGDANKALRLYEQQLKINRATGDMREEGYALGGQGDAALAMGDDGAARRAYEHWLKIARQIGHRKGVALASWKLGLLLVRQGEREKGLNLMADRVAYKRVIGHPSTSELEEEMERLREATTHRTSDSDIARSVG